MNNYQSGQIMRKSEEPNKCLHKNLIPIEYHFARKTWPNGFKEEPNYNATNLLGADTMRVRSYLCLDCKCEIKAPSPGQCRKDIL